MGNHNKIDLNAKLNYWGSSLGPKLTITGIEANPKRDRISNNITYLPLLEFNTHYISLWEPPVFIKSKIFS